MNTRLLINSVLQILQKFYVEDNSLFEKDLCERCLVHRLAYHLQIFFIDYYVDCEFNKSFYGNRIFKKIISNKNGNYVDIIIHKRSNIMGDNLLCFEVKKENNYQDRNKDRGNLKLLTESNFSYILGFYIILGNNLDHTMIEIYEQGSIIGKIKFT